MLEERHRLLIPWVYSLGKRGIKNIQRVVLSNLRSATSISSTSFLSLSLFIKIHNAFTENDVAKHETPRLIAAHTHTLQEYVRDDIKGEFMQKIHAISLSLSDLTHQTFTLTAHHLPNLHTSFEPSRGDDNLSLSLFLSVSMDGWINGG